MENKVQLKEQELVGQEVVLTNIYPKTDTSSVQDTTTGLPLDTRLDHIMDLLHNKLTRVVNSVNGRSGVVVLDADDVGLGNVDNISYATIKKWLTAEMEAMFKQKSLKMFDTRDGLATYIIDDDPDKDCTPFLVEHWNPEPSNDFEKPDYRMAIGLMTYNEEEEKLEIKDSNLRYINTIYKAENPIKYDKGVIEFMLDNGSFNPMYISSPTSINSGGLNIDWPWILQRFELFRNAYYVASGDDADPDYFNLFTNVFYKYHAYHLLTMTTTDKTIGSLNLLVADKKNGFKSILDEQFPHLSNYVDEVISDYNLFDEWDIYGASTERATNEYESWFQARDDYDPDVDPVNDNRELFDVWMRFIYTPNITHVPKWLNQIFVNTPGGKKSDGNGYTYSELLEKYPNLANVTTKTSASSIYVKEILKAKWYGIYETLKAQAYSEDIDLSNYEQTLYVPSQVFQWDNVSASGFFAPNVSDSGLSELDPKVCNVFVNGRRITNPRRASGDFIIYPRDSFNLNGFVFIDNPGALVKMFGEDMLDLMDGSSKYYCPELVFNHSMIGFIVDQADFPSSNFHVGYEHALTGYSIYFQTFTPYVTWGLKNKETFKPLERTINNSAKYTALPGTIDLTTTAQSATAISTAAPYEDDSKGLNYSGIQIISHHDQFDIDQMDSEVSEGDMKQGNRIRPIDIEEGNYKSTDYDRKDGVYRRYDNKRTDALSRMNKVFTQTGTIPIYDPNHPEQRQGGMFIPTDSSLCVTPYSQYGQTYQEYYTGDQSTDVTKVELGREFTKYDNDSTAFDDFMDSPSKSWNYMLDDYAFYLYYRDHEQLTNEADSEYRRRLNHSWTEEIREEYIEKAALELYSETYPIYESETESAYKERLVSLYHKEHDGKHVIHNKGQYIRSWSANSKTVSNWFANTPYYLQGHEIDDHYGYMNPPNFIGINLNKMVINRFGANVSDMTKLTYNNLESENPYESNEGFDDVDVAKVFVPMSGLRIVDAYHSNGDDNSNSHARLTYTDLGLDPLVDAYRFSNDNSVVTLISNKFDKNEKWVWKWLRHYGGFTPVAAAAMMGNMKIEANLDNSYASFHFAHSGSDTSTDADHQEYFEKWNLANDHYLIQHGSEFCNDGVGIGLPWALTSPRKFQMLKYFVDSNTETDGIYTSLSDLTFQLEFMIKELTNEFADYDSANDDLLKYMIDSKVLAVRNTETNQRIGYIGDVPDGEDGSKYYVYDDTKQIVAVGNQPLVDENDQKLLYGWLLTNGSTSNFSDYTYSTRPNKYYRIKYIDIDPGIAPNGGTSWNMMYINTYKHMVNDEIYIDIGVIPDYHGGNYMIGGILGRLDTGTVTDTGVHESCEYGVYFEDTYGGEHNNGLVRGFCINTDAWGFQHKQYGRYRYSGYPYMDFDREDGKNDDTYRPPNIPDGSIFNMNRDKDVYRIYLGTPCSEDDWNNMQESERLSHTVMIRRFTTDTETDGTTTAYNYTESNESILNINPDHREVGYIDEQLSIPIGLHDAKLYSQNGSADTTDSTLTDTKLADGKSPLTIGSILTDSGNPVCAGKFRFYRMTVVRDGVVIHDFTPAKFIDNNGDTVIGIIDLAVTDTVINSDGYIETAKFQAVTVIGTVPEIKYGPLLDGQSDSVDPYVIGYVSEESEGEAFTGYSYDNLIDSLRDTTKTEDDIESLTNLIELTYYRPGLSGMKSTDRVDYAKKYYERYQPLEEEEIGDEAPSDSDFADLLEEISTETIEQTSAFGDLLPSLESINHATKSGGLMVNVGKYLEIDPIIYSDLDLSTGRNYYDWGKVNVRLGPGLIGDGHNRITINTGEGLEIDETGKLNCTVKPVMTITLIDPEHFIAHDLATDQWLNQNSSTEEWDEYDPYETENSIIILGDGLRLTDKIEVIIDDPTPEPEPTPEPTPTPVLTRSGGDGGELWYFLADAYDRSYRPGDHCTFAILRWLEDQTLNVLKQTKKTVTGTNSLSFNDIRSGVEDVSTAQYLAALVLNVLHGTTTFDTTTIFQTITTEFPNISVSSFYDVSSFEYTIYNIVTDQSKQNQLLEYADSYFEKAPRLSFTYTYDKYIPDGIAPVIIKSYPATYETRSGVTTDWWKTLYGYYVMWQMFSNQFVKAYNGNYPPFQSNDLIGYNFKGIDAQGNVDLPVRDFIDLLLDIQANASFVNHGYTERFSNIWVPKTANHASRYDMDQVYNDMSWTSGTTGPSD